MTTADFELMHLMKNFSLVLTKLKIVVFLFIQAHCHLKGFL